MSRLSQSLSLSSLARPNLTDVNNVVTYQYQGRRPRFTQKEKFSSIVSGDISEAVAKIRKERNFLLYYFYLFFFYLVGPLSALDRGYPKFMLQYKSQDFVHTLRGVSALDSSPHILVTSGLGQS